MCISVVWRLLVVDLKDNKVTIVYNQVCSCIVWVMQIADYRRHVQTWRGGMLLKESTAEEIFCFGGPRLLVCGCCDFEARAPPLRWQRGAPLYTTEYSCNSEYHCTVICTMTVCLYMKSCKAVRLSRHYRLCINTLKRRTKWYHLVNICQIIRE